MEKRFWSRLLEKAIVFCIGLVVKNQKGVKGTPNEQKVDEVLKDL
jgi:hypothetical protein